MTLADSKSLLVLPVGDVKIIPANYLIVGVRKGGGRSRGLETLLIVERRVYFYFRKILRIYCKILAKCVFNLQKAVEIVTILILVMSLLKQKTKYK